MTRRRIAVVTGNRADYGLLYWLLKSIEEHHALELQLVVTGAHLTPSFGFTRDDIVKDGFAIAAEVDMNLESDRGDDLARAMGRVASGMAGALSRLAPDIVVVLGDRFEMLAVAASAMLMGLPLAHIHGGEESEGSTDNSTRHAITKMAAFHFAAASPYAERIRQMGEDPEHVFTVGAMAADSIRHLKPLTFDEFAASCGIAMGRPLFLMTYHPETAVPGNDKESVRALAEALDAFPDATVIVTGTNIDKGYGPIIAALRDFIAAKPSRRHWFASLGRERYLNGVVLADAVIGNSSSGIIEAPLLGTPTINIGARQGGRLRAPSIIDCRGARQDIKRAIDLALSDDFRSMASRRQSPYGSGDAAHRIADILANVALPPAAKRFRDFAMDPAA